MSLSVYNIVFIICNIFNTYIIVKLMRVFFDKETTNIKIVVCSYIGYFLATTFLHLFVNVPILMLIFNILFLFLVSLNYSVNLKIRVFSIIFMYLLLMLIEEIIVIISGYTYNTMFTESSYSSIWGFILIKLVTFTVVDIMEKNKYKKRGIDIPIIYWLCICVIPFISLYMIFIIFQKKYLSNLQIMFIVSTLLFENFVVFYLYDSIIIKLESKAENLLLEQQNQFYCRQINLMQTSLQSIKDIRHDLKNHLSTMRTLAREENVECIMDYIDKIDDSTNLNCNKSNSNNITIDSIINFKYKEALQDGIEFNTDINVPNKLNIESFDLTVILGNLIDNALQAAKCLLKNKKIDIKIKYDKGRLLIKIVNDYDGIINLKNEIPETNKPDKENHGIGFKNIKKTLEKYKGEMDIYTKDNKFYVSVILYTLNNINSF